MKYPIKKIKKNTFKLTQTLKPKIWANEAQNTSKNIPLSRAEFRNFKWKFIIKISLKFASRIEKVFLREEFFLHNISPHNILKNINFSPYSSHAFCQRIFLLIILTHFSAILRFPLLPLSMAIIYNTSLRIYPRQKWLPMPLK